ncbi:alpha/beta hydrolase [Croceivirga thetidis]|uniref:Alpha/beta hydrolase n=1 Tax=Croceivirga thetidis TaxID=2721623 RepID=A0ABX1GSS3_9FLAO|nr:alpha/beta hydrolase [Croceivirga thetidis]NKI33002.1 alpha/beta hydrolase [Croceivirga thetidis]
MNTKLPSLFLVLFFALHFCNAQELIIKKGIVVDSINVKGTPEETFALFLPENFENKGTWPLLVVIDEKGRGKKSLSTFSEAGKDKGYIMAASNAVNDSLSITENVQRMGRLFASLSALFPLNNNRVYVGGFDAGGRLANLMPIFFKNLNGVISCGANFSNTELVDSKNPFHFIGIVGLEDFDYINLRDNEAFFNKLKFDNNILLHEGGKVWPPKRQLSKALDYLKLRSMAKVYTEMDSIFIQGVLTESLNDVKTLISTNKFLLAHRELKEIQNAFRVLINTDSIENAIRELKRDKNYRSQKRKHEDALFKEVFLKEDYQYYLDEDVRTFNYNNLGWWKYQIEELQKLDKGESIEQQKMAKRLAGYVNALIDDAIDFNQLKEEGKQDDEALLFLNMLKTITSPDTTDSYLRVISLSAKYEDFGTAIFYLEELLKKGFTDRDRLYKLSNTALLRITPEFNEVVEKYLKSARYEIKE